MKKTGYNIIQFSLSKELQHGMMVSILAGELARKAGLSEEQCHELSIAGLLHDIGKLEMAKYVYQKGQKPLTIEEIKYVRLHPTLGYAITSQNHYSDFIIKSILPVGALAEYSEKNNRLVQAEALAAEAECG